MFLKILAIYCVIAITNFFINLYRMLHTKYLYNKYLKNINSKEFQQNFELIIPITKVLNKAHKSYFGLESDLKMHFMSIALENAFFETFYHYKYLMKHCFTWLTRIPVPKTKFIYQIFNFFTLNHYCLFIWSLSWQFRFRVANSKLSICFCKRYNLNSSDNSSFWGLNCMSANCNKCSTFWLSRVIFLFILRLSISNQINIVTATNKSTQFIMSVIIAIPSFLCCSLLFGKVLLIVQLICYTEL